MSILMYVSKVSERIGPRFGNYIYICVYLYVIKNLYVSVIIKDRQQCSEPDSGAVLA